MDSLFLDFSKKSRWWERMEEPENLFQPCSPSCKEDGRCTSKTWIGFAGYKGCGKNTLAKWLVKDHGFKEVQFAGKLKKVLSILFDWDESKLQGLTPEDRGWRESIDPFWSQVLGWEVTPRRAMQVVGTDLGRKMLGLDFWVHSTLSSLSSEDRVVVTDVRFSNEMTALQEKGGRVFFITRPSTDPKWWPFPEEIPAGTHSSDTDILDCISHMDGFLVNDHESEEEFVQYAKEKLFL